MNELYGWLLHKIAIWRFRRLLRQRARVKHD